MGKTVVRTLSNRTRRIVADERDSGTITDRALRKASGLGADGCAVTWNVSRATSPGSLAAAA
jgi:hypothetical protein